MKSVFLVPLLLVASTASPLPWNFLGKLAQGGADLLNLAKDGIDDATDAAIDTAGNVAQGALNLANKGIDTVADGIGTVVPGLHGVTDTIANAADGINDLGHNALEDAGGAVQQVERAATSLVANTGDNIAGVTNPAPASPSGSST